MREIGYFEQTSLPITAARPRWLFTTLPVFTLASQQMNTAIQGTLNKPSVEQT
jgi:hypothetical protein